MRNSLGADEIDAFAEVANCLSFRTAAERLNVSASALSRRVQKLEEKLDAKLFERTTRHVKLTLPGKHFLARSQQIRADIEELVTAIKGQSSGQLTTVTIAVIPSIAYQLLPSILHTFNALYPTTRVQIRDLTTNEVVEAVARGEAAFGITSFVQPEASLTFTPLIRGSFVLAMPREHPLSKRKRVNWAELAGHRVISTWKGSGVRITMDSELAKVARRLNACYEVQQVYTALAFVESGLGVAPVPDHFVSKITKARIVTAALVDPIVKIDFGTVLSRNHPLGRQAGALYELLEKAVHSRAAIAS